MPKARLCLLIVELETIKITRATSVNGKFVRPSVGYRWRWSFFMTSGQAKVTVGKFSPLEMIVMEYFCVHFATDKLDIATLMQPRCYSYVPPEATMDVIDRGGQVRCKLRHAFVCNQQRRRDLSRYRCNGERRKSQIRASVRDAGVYQFRLGCWVFISKI